MSARILVIDDSTTLRKLVEIAMRGTGMEVDFAATGSDGVTRARTARPDVILLDFLLPDLESTEVCQQLADDQSTARVPVVVMSANQATVFEAFRGFPAVVDFVGKPFTASEIRARLEAAITAGGPADPARVIAVRPRRSGNTLAPPTGVVAPVLPTDKLDVATQAIARALAGGIEKLSAAEPPAGVDRMAFLAKLLLTPETVSEIVRASATVTEASTTGDLQLQGDLMSTPLLEVLRLLTTATATGVLSVAIAGTFEVYLRRGEVLMCTTTRFDRGSLGSVALAALPKPIVQRAQEDQRLTGKPALVTFAQAGVTRVTDLPAELHAIGGRLLAELFAARAGRFAWTPMSALPDYVDAFGRHLSVTAVALAHQRTRTSSTTAPLFLEEIYDRTPRFSEKLVGARLSSDEQRMLAMIDGRSTVRELLAKAELSSDKAATIIARLRNVDLIRSEGISVVGEVAGGVVAVLDPDRDGFIIPLRAHLARRPQPIEVSELAPENLATQVLKIRPRLLIVNARLLTRELLERELMPLAQTGQVTLAAVLDAPDPVEIDEILSSSMHAVLVKPVHLNDFERLLSL